MGTSILFILTGMVLMGMMVGGIIAKIMSVAGKEVTKIILSATKKKHPT